MRHGHKAIVRLDETTREDIPFVGGNRANPGEMTQARTPVPPGFIVTVDACFDFLKRAGITATRRDLLAPLGVQDSRQRQDITDVKARLNRQW